MPQSHAHKVHPESTTFERSGEQILAEARKLPADEDALVDDQTDDEARLSATTRFSRTWMGLSSWRGLAELIKQGEEAVVASIAKRPDGRWRARYRDVHGKEHSRHFGRKIDAQNWLDSVTTAVQTGVYVLKTESLRRVAPRRRV